MKAIIVAGIFLEQAKEQAAASGCSAALHRRSPLPHLRLTSRWRKSTAPQVVACHVCTSLLTREQRKYQSPTCSLSACSLAPIESTKKYQKNPLNSENGRRPPVSPTVYQKVEADDGKLACTHCMSMTL